MQYNDNKAMSNKLSFYCFSRSTNKRKIVLVDHSSAWWSIMIKVFKGNSTRHIRSATLMKASGKLNLPLLMATFAAIHIRLHAISILLPLWRHVYYKARSILQKRAMKEGCRSAVIDLCIFSMILFILICRLLLLHETVQKMKYTHCICTLLLKRAI